MSKQVDLLILAEGSRGVARRHRCEGRQRLVVRDLTSRSVIQVPADEVSIYRHTLLLTGVAYRILNIFKLA